MKNKNIGKCTTSLAELKKNRDSQGFIILDDANISTSVDSREKLGNALRDKDWIKFPNRKEYLLKLEDDENANIKGCCYAELICKKLAEQVDLPYANYEIVKKGDKFGVLSEKITKSDEQMFTLNELTDDIPVSDKYADLTDLTEIDFKLIERFANEGLEKKEIKRLLKDLHKVLIFDTFVIATDRHPENISFTRNNKTGQFNIGKIYDTENSLLIEMDKENIDLLTEDYYALKSTANNNCPRMVIFPDDNIDGDYKADELWMYTFDELTSPDELRNFANDCIKKLDIEKAIEDMENDIGAKLPQNYYEVAKYAFLSRMEKIEQLFERGYDDMVKNKNNINNNNIIDYSKFLGLGF